MYIISYDIGTTSNKTCLFEVDKSIRLLAHASGGYALTLTEDGGAEQDPEDWWRSMCATTKQVLEKSGVKPGLVSGISFCSQLQCLVLTDSFGRAVRPAMSYMDARASEEFEQWSAGPFKIAGVCLKKLIPSLMDTGVVAASAKDPVFRYNYVKNREPEAFARVHKWLDAKDYLIARATGRFIMTNDSAFATLLYSPKTKRFSERMARLHHVDMAHLPEIVASTDPVGPLTREAAEALGLTENAIVYGGAGDSNLAGVGAGQANVGDTHACIGTSGWICTVCDKPAVDTSAMIAAIEGALKGRYNYFAEMETAGKCLEWAKNIFLSEGASMEEFFRRAEAGSGGVLFAPWLLGNRCPFEDAYAKAMFFNMRLETTVDNLISAVLDGVLYQLRWMLEVSNNKVKGSKVLRLVGGAARSELVSQRFADITGRTIEVPEAPQNTGALGACLLAAAGAGLMSIEQGCSLVEVGRRCVPDPEKKAAYDKQYAAFLRLHRNNKKTFSLLNR